MMFTNLFLASCLAMAMAKPPVMPRQSTCASMPSFMTGNRIVGGQAASKPIPWQVSVRSCTDGGCHFCGGTILDAKTVMSAAHCFTTGASMAGKYITAGVTNRNDATSGQTIEIEKGVWNSAMPYNSQSNNNDYVILKLKSALAFNDNVQPACLPEASYAPEGNGPTCYVSGWGTLQSGAQTLPTDLQWVGVPLITNTKCATSYTGITTSMICAGFDQGGKDSCQGDSGGPLVCAENGKAVLTGVVSFGAGCAAAGFPGVYARMTTVLDWVKSNMETSSTPAPQPPAPAPQPPAPAPEPPAPAPEPPAPAPQPPTTGCGNESWKGDNYCDDGNNNAGCAYDGGDCCGDNVNTSFCTECKCLDPNGSSPAPQPPAPAPQPPAPAPEPPATSGCGVESWKGDGFCDDENNNAGCAYDGGDCCGDNVNTTYCSECKCLQ